MIWLPPAAGDATSQRRGGGRRIVGDHYHRLAHGLHRLARQPEHVAGAVAVQRAGGLVSEERRGSGDQRPGDRHPLLLSARQRIRPVAPPVARADRRDDLGDLGPTCRTLVLTGLGQPGNLLRALKVDVRGFIVKDAPAEALADASAASQGASG